MSIEIERILQNEIFRQIFAHCDVRVDRINESGRKKVFRRKKGFSAWTWNKIRKQDFEKHIFFGSTLRSFIFSLVRLLVNAFYLGP